MKPQKERYCPKCGSTYVQGSSDGCGTTRFHYCMSCGYGRWYAFPTVPPKNPKVKPRSWKEIQKDRREYG